MVRADRLLAALSRIAFRAALMGHLEVHPREARPVPLCLRIRRPEGRSRVFQRRSRLRQMRLESRIYPIPSRPI